MKYGMLAAVLVVSVLPSFANSISFTTYALQNEGFTKIRLDAGLNPLLTATTTIPNRSLSFATIFNVIGPYSASYTLDLAGQQFTSAQLMTGVCSNPNGCGVIFSFMVPPSYKSTNGTLTMNLNGVTVAYTFQYLTAVPEPGAWVLVGTGLVLVAVLWRRHSHNSQRQMG